YGATKLTLTVGAALRPAAANGRGAAALTKEELAPIVAAAIVRWAAAGITPAEVDRLRRVHVELADLDGVFLGLEGDDTILIDRTADGDGWFIDPTPLSDREFAPTAKAGELVARTGGPARGLMDLLTVVMHEMGHVLGLGDAHEGSSPDTLMTEDLPTG